MNVNLFLLIAFCIALLFILFLVTKLRRVRGQLSIIEEALEDIKSGNLNRRMLTKKNDMTRKICYGINDIAMNSQTQLIRQKQSEQAYKRLMTSIPHDVKTPLASLVGYLEAIECKIVAGEEKDEYVHVAFEKADYLKHFVENLFEWVKLDSGEHTSKNLRTIPVTSTQLIIAKISMLFIFSIAFCLISTLSVALFCKLFHVGMVYGMTYKILMCLIFGAFIVAASLPIVFLIICFNKSFLLSILLAFFYSIFNWGILGTVGTSISTAKIRFLNSFPVICVMNWLSGSMMDHLQKDNLLPEAYLIVPTTSHTILIVAITVILSLWLIIRFYKKWTR